MADYWKSQARKFCDFCKCWIADNKPSVEFHEHGKKHKENVAKRLKEIHKNSSKQAKQQKKFDADFKKMEDAAMAAYLKDVESDNRDLTSDKIIQEKWAKKESNDNAQRQHGDYNPNQVPNAAPEAHSRFSKSSYLPKYGAADVDPLDPYAQQKLARIAAREAKAEKKAASKKNKNDSLEKDKNKTVKQQPTGSQMPLRKVWYEARSQGYSYYWHIETNETVWEPPAEGFMSLQEQAEEAKEQSLQEQFLKQIEEEETKKKAEVIEEQRANAEREKLKEIRKRFYESKKVQDSDECTVAAEEKSVEKEILYRRDYSVPDKPQPYGTWQVVKRVEQPKIDLQLPRVKETPTVDIPFEEPPPQRVFKEKIITHVSTGDSDEEEPSVSFKKRKFGNKNVRKRASDN